MPLPLLPLLLGTAGRMGAGAVARGAGASAGKQLAAKAGGQAAGQFGAQALQQSSQKPTHQDPTLMQSGRQYVSQHPGQAAAAVTLGAIKLGSQPSPMPMHAAYTNELLQSTQFR